MKKYIIPALAGLICSLFVGCTELELQTPDPLLVPEFVNGSKPEIILRPDFPEQEFCFYAPAEWTIEIEDRSTINNWFIIDKMKGDKGLVHLLITLDEPRLRKGAFYIVMGDTRTKVVVKGQSYRTDQPSVLMFAKEAADRVLHFGSDDGIYYNFTTDADWIKVSRMDQGLQVEVEANDTGKRRCGNIILTDCDEVSSDTLLVVQHSEFIGFDSPALQHYLVGLYDSSKDGKLSFQEMFEVQELYLTGDAFPADFALNEISMNFPNLSDINIERLDGVRNIEMSEVGDIDLFVSSCPSLLSLSIADFGPTDYNTGIQVKNCPALQKIVLKDSRMDECIILNNPALKDLLLDHTQILHLSANYNGLENFESYSAAGYRSTIDVSNNNLKQFILQDPLEETMFNIVANYNSLSHLDLSGVVVNVLELEHNLFTSFNGSDFPELHYLTLIGNPLEGDLDLTASSNLITLRLSGNVAFKVNGETLHELELENRDDTVLDLSEITGLEVFKLKDASCKHLKFSEKARMEGIYVNYCLELESVEMVQPMYKYYSNYSYHVCPSLKKIYVGPRFYDVPLIINFPDSAKVIVRTRMN